MCDVLQLSLLHLHKCAVKQCLFRAIYLGRPIREFLLNVFFLLFIMWKNVPTLGLSCSYVHAQSFLICVCSVRPNILRTTEWRRVCESDTFCALLSLHTSCLLYRRQYCDTPLHTLETKLVSLWNHAPPPQKNKEMAARLPMRFHQQWKLLHGPPCK